jgi:4-hydroxybenzoyl-CoA thioesterase/acyl-CoA thioester hydrolase
MVDVAVSIVKIGRKSVTYGFEFSKDGEVVARGQVSSVCCRVHPDHALASMEIPPSFRAKLEAAD